MSSLVALVVIGLVTSSDGWAQGERVELLLTGDEYHATDLPRDPAGPWWVLHRPTGTPILEDMQVVVTPMSACSDAPDERSGRAVTVPRAGDPILLVRGSRKFLAGPVPTAFVDQDGSGERLRIQALWQDEPVIVERTADLPSGDQPGQYRVDLAIGDRHFQLHTDQWHGDGHWLVRWIGDLNRDGWPDVLLDASYKYSVHTTRLFLSHASGQEIGFNQAARFGRSAC